MDGLGGLPAGCVRVLNVGAGDLKLTFDSSDPVEVERARRTVEDMLQRGYVLLADVPRKGRRPKGEEEGKRRLVRVKGFDPRADEYLIATDALYPGGEAGGEEQEAEGEGRSRKARSKTTRIPAREARVAAVGRSAGG